MKKSNWYTDNGTRLKKFDYKIEINNPFINNKFCDNSQIMVFNCFIHYIFWVKNVIKLEKL